MSDRSHQRIVTPRTAAVERQVEVYLDRVAAGNPPDLEDCAQELDSDPERATFRVEALAGELLWRQEIGEPVELAVELARLPNPEERSRLSVLVEGALEATRRLPWRLEPGSRLAGRYEILDVLGTGGIGVVYEAIDQELGRRVAIKAVRVDPARDASELTRNLVEESRTLAGLKSPNIVIIFDVLREGDRVCVVLDRICGIGLDEAILELSTVRDKESGELSPTSKVDVLREALGTPDGTTEGVLFQGGWYSTVVAMVGRLAHAMERAHEEGVLHRDLKPQNVMLQTDGEPVLLDFGLAHRVGARVEGERRFQGTPEYLAPEQVANMETGQDPRTDVYSLGLLIYELLALERAFPRRKDEPITALLTRIQAREFKPLEELDPHAPVALRRICEHAMEADPDQRYASMSELREDLDLYLAGLPPRHAPMEWPHVLRMKTRQWLRNPLPAAILTVAVLGAWGGWETFRPRDLPAFQDYVAVSPDSGETRTIDMLSELDGNEMLGVRLAGEKRGHVYAMAISGPTRDAEDLVVRPTHPTLDMSFERECWGLEVPAGQNDVFCAVIEPDDVGQWEGIMVMVLPGRDSEMEEIFDQVPEEGTTWLELERQIDSRLHSRGVDPAQAKTMSQFREILENTRTGSADGTPQWMTGLFRVVQH